MVAPEQSVSLRPFPHPYRAGLAICSDIDGCDRETFIRVHRYLNTRDRGLGLPVADSFFGVGREPGQMAFFLDDGLTPSPDAQFIREAIAHGLIDSLHSWGDFNGAPPDAAFLRKTAERLKADLLNHGFQLKVWINHGDPCNRQNLRARLQQGYRGDDPESPYYTADLVKELGIKFYWWSELTRWPLSVNKAPSRGRLPLRLALNALKNVVKLATNRRRRVRAARDLTELCIPVSTGEGMRLLGFTRFSRHPRSLWALTTRHTLRHALSAEVLDELLEQEGYLVLYTHLGLPVEKAGDLFPPEDRRVLEGLAERHDAGDIWVAPTAALLTYWLVSRNLVWEARAEGDRIIIEVQGLDDPVTGPRVPLESELAGLCFYSARPRDTVIRLSGEELDTVVHDPDHSGMASRGFAPPPAPRTDLLED